MTVFRRPGVTNGAIGSVPYMRDLILAEYPDAKFNEDIRHRLSEAEVIDFLRDCDPMDSLLLVTNRVVRVDVWTGAITWIWYEGVFVPVVQRAKDQLRSRGAEWLKSA